jgi:hypothetical protein
MTANTSHTTRIRITLLCVMAVLACLVISGRVSAENQIPCEPSWSCTQWGPCTPNGEHERTCEDSNHCESVDAAPAQRIACTREEVVAIEQANQAAATNVGEPSSAEAFAVNGHSDQGNAQSASVHAFPESVWSAFTGRTRPLWFVFLVLVFVFLLAVLSIRYFFLWRSHRRGAHRKR